LFILILILGVTSMNACGFLGIGGTAKWKEEVLLHDGSKIIVERWQKHGGRGEVGQSPIKEHTVTFTLPGTKRMVTWKDEYSEDIGHSNFDLVALHILNDTSYIVTTAYGCLAYNKWGRPNPPYVIFRFDGNVWKRIKLSELPLEFNNVNLVINSSAHEEELVTLGLASAEKVKELNCSLTQEEYKTIIRTPIKIWCEEMIYDGHGKWLGIDWFTSQPSYKACLTVCNRQRFSAEYCPCKKIFNNKIKGE
jgi:hypothetical protein